MVNIIIPTYKARNTLPLALKSLEAQTKRMFLVTIVQDCDGEDYSDIIDASPLNITLIQTPYNGGPGLARKMGLEATFQSNCDYVMFLDSDDMLYPTAVDTLVREINKTKVDIVVSNFYSEKKFVGTHTYAHNMNGIWMHGKIYRVSYLRNNGINFLSSVRTNEDANFNLKALSVSDNIAHIDEITYLWREQHNSITRKDTLQFFIDGVNDFMFAQNDALKFIKEKTGKIPADLIAKSFGFIYNWYMISKERGGMPNEELVREFFDLEDVRQSFENKSFVRLAVDKEIEAAFVGFKHCVFFHEPVDLWYKRITQKELIGE